jgi:hypothetical protein
MIAGASGVRRVDLTQQDEGVSHVEQHVEVSAALEMRGDDGLGVGSLFGGLLEG